MTKKRAVSIGDWVSAEKANGDVYTGWVSQIVGGTASIYIPSVESYAPFSLQTLAICPVYYTEEELDDVIDLALLLKDKAWFEELIKEKESIKWSS
ncbi:hypothetical protein D3C71_234530 [compost metagenome]